METRSIATDTHESLGIESFILTVPNIFGGPADFQGWVKAPSFHAQFIGCIVENDGETALARLEENVRRAADDIVMELAQVRGPHHSYEDMLVVAWKFQVIRHGSASDEAQAAYAELEIYRRENGIPTTVIEDGECLCCGAEVGNAPRCPVCDGTGPDDNEIGIDIIEVPDPSSSSAAGHPAANSPQKPRLTNHEIEARLRASQERITSRSRTTQQAKLVEARKALIEAEAKAAKHQVQKLRRDLGPAEASTIIQSQVDDLFAA